MSNMWDNERRRQKAYLQKMMLEYALERGKTVIVMSPTSSYKIKRVHVGNRSLDVIEDIKNGRS